MAEALVYGLAESLASKLADAASDVLRLPVHYRRAPGEAGGDGVALCTTSTAFTPDAPRLLFADEVPGDAGRPNPDREAALTALSEAAAAGQYVAIISSTDQLRRWRSLFEDAAPPRERPLKRLYIVGESGAGKSTLAKKLAPQLGIPLVRLDEEIWAEDAPEEFKGRATEVWLRRIREIADGPEWVCEGVYWRAADILAARADAVVYLDLPASVVAKHREQRADAPAKSLREKVVLGVYKKTYPFFEARLLRHELSAHAHEVPVFRLRNESERAAFEAGVASGAARERAQP